MPTNSKTEFAGKIYVEKDPITGVKQLVLSQAEWATVMADAAVQAATTVAGLRSAITAAIAALT
jgi:hypothetical protein